MQSLAHGSTGANARARAVSLPLGCKDAVISRTPCPGGSFRRGNVIIAPNCRATVKLFLVGVHSPRLGGGRFARVDCSVAGSPATRHRVPFTFLLPCLARALENLRRLLLPTIRIPEAAKWLRNLLPDSKRRVRAAPRGLERWQGDVKPFQGELGGFYRLRVGGYRIVCRAVSKSVIHLEYADTRDVVYEAFRQLRLLTELDE
jgi:mRNA-degrading endonuclease RelE of RelBE toxin-antitoxin system